MEIVRLLGKKENGFGRRGEAVGICMVVHGGYPRPARDGHVCVYVKERERSLVLSLFSSLVDANSAPR